MRRDHLKRESEQKEQANGMDKASKKSIFRMQLSYRE